MSSIEETMTEIAEEITTSAGGEGEQQHAPSFDSAYDVEMVTETVTVTESGEDFDEEEAKAIEAEALQSLVAALSNPEATAQMEAEADAEAAALPPEDIDPEKQKRIVEALLFAATSAMDVATLAQHLAKGPQGQGIDGVAAVEAALQALKADYAGRGVDLVESNGRWSLRTSPDLADYLRVESVKPVKLSRAVSETLAVIAYHQPVTRAEIEAVRGVATSKGTLDYLMQLGWVRPGRRREIAGRPLTWITTPAFLDHFGLGSTRDLPGMDELKAAGLLDPQPQATYGVMPTSSDDAPVEANAPVEEMGAAQQDSDLEFMASEETIEQFADEPTEMGADMVAAEEGFDGDEQAMPQQAAVTAGPFDAYFEPDTAAQQLETEDEFEREPA